jgi:DNA gyrase subunit A
MVISENGYGKRSPLEDYRITNRGGKGVKTISITEKTGDLVAIKSVTDDNDLVIINKSGITLRVNVADIRLMGRATQGVRLINLEKRNDTIASVCCVDSDPEEDVDTDAIANQTEIESTSTEVEDSINVGDNE